MSLESALRVELNATLTSAVDLGPDPRYPLALRYAVSLADGTAAGKANVLWTDERTLAASATEDLDLNGTALQDVFGTDIALAKVKALVVHAAAANTHNVLVGGASSNAWAALFGDATDVLVVRPGAVVAVVAGESDATGYAVTAGTGDLLKVANSGGVSAVTYDIAIVGTDA